MYFEKSGGGGGGFFRFSFAGVRHILQNYILRASSTTAAEVTAVVVYI